VLTGTPLSARVNVVGLGVVLTVQVAALSCVMPTTLAIVSGSPGLKPCVATVMPTPGFACVKALITAATARPVALLEISDSSMLFDATAVTA
jgi:hypothetical protein